MIIVGIDQSLTATGVCIRKGEFSYEVLVLETKKMRGIGRVDWIVKAFEQLFDSCLTAEDMKGIVGVREGYSYNSKGRSSSMCENGELVGCLDLLFHRRSLPLYVIPPANHKKFFFGNGAVNKKDKKLYLSMVYQQCGIAFKDDNEADSYILTETMQTIIAIVNGEKSASSLSNPQREALIPKSIRKKAGITDKGLQSLADEGYASLLEDAMLKFYKRH